MSAGQASAAQATALLPSQSQQIRISYRPEPYRSPAKPILSDNLGELPASARSKPTNSPHFFVTAGLKLGRAGGVLTYCGLMKAT
jgi:hypothetical protein